MLLIVLTFLLVVSAKPCAQTYDECMKEVPSGVVSAYEWLTNGASFCEHAYKLCVKFDER